MVDSGNLLFKRQHLPEGESQEKITAAGIIRAYGKMGYDAVAVGPLDLAAGVDFLKEKDRSHFPWLSANLLNADNQPVFHPWIVKILNGSTIGIIGLTSKSSFLPVNIHLADWHSILPPILKTLSEKCDHIILLSNLVSAENHQIAQQFPEVSVIISADSRFGNLSPTINNNTLITQTAPQGRYLGKLTISWGNNDKWNAGFTSPINALQTEKEKENKNGAKGTIPSTFSANFIALTSSMPENADVQHIVTDIKQQTSDFNKKIRFNKLDSESTNQSNRSTVALIGYERCESCHHLQTEFWKSTQHASAYTTLVDMGQSNNLDCLVCHVTRRTDMPWQNNTVTTLLSLPLQLQTVGCEVCHGAGTAHAGAPERVLPIRNPTKEVCLQCHTKKRDAAFDYQKKIKLIQCPKNNA